MRARHYLADFLDSEVWVVKYAFKLHVFLNSIVQRKKKNTFLNAQSSIKISQLCENEQSSINWDPSQINCTGWTKVDLTYLNKGNKNLVWMDSRAQHIHLHLRPSIS